MRPNQKDHPMDGYPADEQRRALIAQGLALLGLTACGGALAALAGGCESDTTKSENETVVLDVASVGKQVSLPLADAPEVAAIGGAVKKTFPGVNGDRPLVIVRTTETTFVALSAICTHQGCEVRLPNTDGELVCPCHSSRFDLDGIVLAGPATAPLAMFPVTLDTETNSLGITIAPDLPPEGGAIKRTFGTVNGGRPVVIIRWSATEFTVFSAVCTHQSCEVGLPTTPGGKLVCPCHGSAFASRTGKVEKGPASAPLQVFPARFDSVTGELTISF